MTAMRLLDIGGSGVKTAKLHSDAEIDQLSKADIEYFAHPDWQCFVPWLEKYRLIDERIIGISCPGFI